MTYVFGWTLNLSQLLLLLGVIRSVHGQPCSVGMRPLPTSRLLFSILSVLGLRHRGVSTDLRVREALHVTAVTALISRTI